MRTLDNDECLAVLGGAVAHHSGRPMRGFPAPDIDPALDGATDLLDDGFVDTKIELHRPRRLVP